MTQFRERDNKEWNSERTKRISQYGYIKGFCQSDNGTADINNGERRDAATSTTEQHAVIEQMDMIHLRTIIIIIALRND